MEEDSVQHQRLNPVKSQSVPYILNLLFAQSPQHFKSTLQNAFNTFTHVLLRQKQLAQCQFYCNGNGESSVLTLTDAFCVKLNLERKDLDPDRIIWVTSETLAKYLIRPAQWVKVCKFREESTIEELNVREDDYKCQILPMPGAGAPNFISVNQVTEYNLRKSLNIPPFMPIPPLQLKPLLTDPLIKTPNQSLSFSPIHGKSVKLTRLKSSRDVNQTEYDVLIQDVFALNCKYLCVGDLISLPIFPNIHIDLIVSEINDKKVGDACKELFKVTRDSSRVSLNSFEAYNQFHPKADNNAVNKSLAPCLVVPFQKMCGWIKQALISNHYSLSSDSGMKGKFSSELWPNILIYGPIGSGKFSVCQSISSAFGLNFYFINGVNLVGDTSAYTEGKLKAVYDKVANSLCPALIFIKNLHLVGKDKDGNEDKRVIIAFKEFLQDIATLSTDPNSLPLHEARNVMTTRAIFVVGSTEYPEKLVSSISQSCLYKLEFSGTMKPIEEVELTLKWLLDKGGVSLEKDVELKEWTKNNCEGMQRSFGDLKAMAATIVRNAFNRMQTTTREDTPAGQGVPQVSQEDLNMGLSTIDAVLKKAASTVEVPKVSWDDIGGLEEIKKELINSVKLPLEYPHLFGTGVKRSGILLYGPPGTGKTLIAKAVATEFKLSFLSVKGPELLNMYVGQSEQNVRDVFAKARNAAPCIIFFDELDALAPNRGRAGDSGGVMDRVVSQILAELDGTHSSLGVFVIGATNRPDLIDSALLRPGRFDKLLYVGVSQDDESKLSVLKALTRKFNFGKDVDLQEIASQLPSGMSGADLYSLCSDAYMTAISRNIALVTEGKQQDVESGVLVNKCDFETAISRAVPSLSQSEQEKYEFLKSKVNR